MDNDTNKQLSPLDIPPHLLERFNQSGPRYTSYPTAPQFSSDFDRKKVLELWKESSLSEKGLSLYIHFPFCKSRCLYCGCYTEVGKTEDTKKEYLHTLRKESQRILSHFPKSRLVGQLALGGGSPTSLGADLIDYLKGLFEMITFSEDAELSVEVDPREITADYLHQLSDIGFNRFSFGVQDLNAEVQKKVNRILDRRDLEGLVKSLKDKGISAINMDLIYGLPGQTPESFRETIDKIIEYKPSRIALFGYAHVPWVSPHQKVLERYTIPSPEERAQLFGLAFETLLQAGYRHVGMDHFALPEDELIVALEQRSLTRNFMGYTTRRGLDLVGLGASSISSVNYTYTQNLKSVSAFIENNGDLHWIKGLALSPEDRLRREIIIDLFCNFYLDIQKVENSFSVNFHQHFDSELRQLREFEVLDLLSITKREILITDLGRFFIRNICMVFDQYLKGESSEGRYSKTV